MTESRYARPTAVEDETLVPVCPHCGGSLETIRSRRLEASGGAAFGFGRRHVYGCPHCGVLLGITHRKGFWMG